MALMRSLKPLVFGLKPLDRLLVLAALVGVAGVQRLAHPFQHLVVEVQPAEQIGELRFQRLLAHILAAAGGRVALAFIGVAGAVVIDVALLLDLADHRAAAVRAGDQAGEGEVVRHAALVLLGEAAVQHALHALPQFDRDQRLVLALDRACRSTRTSRCRADCAGSCGPCSPAPCAPLLRIDEARRPRLAAPPPSAKCRRSHTIRTAWR